MPNNDTHKILSNETEQKSMSHVDRKMNWRLCRDYNEPTFDLRITNILGLNQGTKPN